VAQSSGRSLLRAGTGCTSASVLLVSVALPGGWINVPFTSLGDIDAQNEGWDTWKMHPENLLW
jgi:hypothetical protein